MSQALVHGAAECENELYCSRLAHGKDNWRVVVNTEMNFGDIQRAVNFLTGKWEIYKGQ
jgi:hypothetical protein